MRVAISLRMGDLGRPVFTGTRMMDGHYQVSIDEDNHIFTHVTADEAVSIATAWVALAEQLQAIEATWVKS